MLKDQAGDTDGYLYDSYIVPERKVHSGTILDCGLQILD